MYYSPELQKIDTFCTKLYVPFSSSRQGLSLRGNNDDIKSSQNPGHFLALLKVFAEQDDILHSHLYQPKWKNATYLSPRSQNEIIDVTGNGIISAKIISEIIETKFFSILADEVTSHNVEHLALCIRFVDAKCDIREEFVAFVQLQRVRASDITNAIISKIEELGLSLHDVRGQGYDGAATMSGERSSVQWQIRDRQPKALYTHCAGHSFQSDYCTFLLSPSSEELY